uniref:TCDD-inducible poly(ADP-ribose) polymerase n=1 Tax=Tetraodon nigroviridis TaxID=99883 RepID=H3CNZ0_TETNG
QKSGVPTAISLDMSLNVDAGDEFAEQQIVGLSDKIPLVKPHFKKKSRKLDAKCLHQALEDPILSTLLRSDSLVSGDGVFVPCGRPGRTPATLCAAAVTKQNRLGQVSADRAAPEAGVPGLVTRDGHVDIAETGVDLEESRPPTEPKVGAPIPDARCFQPKPVLRAAGSKAAASHKGVLFQDKSEEASLDLVFELLTQLQYHTHQSDSVDICVDFLQGRCAYGNDCAHHHTVLPYHWQIRRSSGQTWHSIADDSQEQLERLFCNPDNEHASLKFQ